MNDSVIDRNGRTLDAFIGFQNIHVAAVDGDGGISMDGIITSGQSDFAAINCDAFIRMDRIICRINLEDATSNRKRCAGFQAFTAFNRIILAGGNGEITVMIASWVSAWMPSRPAVM